MNRYVFALIALLCLGFGCKISTPVRALWYNRPGLEDYKFMPHRIVKAENPQALPNSVAYSGAELPDSFIQELKDCESVSFLVLKKDSVVAEWYNDRYHEGRLTNPFSVTKSIVSILVGIALKEGKIKSLDEPIYPYYKEYAKHGRDVITFRNLLSMKSGLDYEDRYTDPFSRVVKLVYGDSIPKVLSSIGMRDCPGEDCRYKNCDTQVLGIALANAVGMPLSKYAEEKLWKPLGATHDAYWLVDHPFGTERMFCCFNSHARDLARIGMLYNHFGNWNGTQIVDSSYVLASIQDTSRMKGQSGIPKFLYSYGWYIHPETEYFSFAAEGMMAQYVVVIPEKELVIVRLGKKWGRDAKEVQDCCIEKDPTTPQIFYSIVAHAIKIWGQDQHKAQGPTLSTKR